MHTSEPLHLEDYGAIYGEVSEEQKVLNRQAVERALAVRPYRTIELTGTLEIDPLGIVNGFDEVKPNGAAKVS